MLFRLSARSLIYVVCPAFCEAGGSHALHQLCHELALLDHRPRMVFARVSDVHDAFVRGASWQGAIVRRSIAPAFPRYRIAQAFEIEDAAEHVLIVPEVAPNLLGEFRYIQKAVWWLSTWRTYAEDVHLPDVSHLCQSAAALRMLVGEGCGAVFPLSDYVTITPVRTRKQRQIAFNPAKGLEITRAIMARAPDLTFVAVQGLREREVAQLLGQSMVYIDFGHHPGKDRLPREAASSGCCVIVGRTGSAAIFQDVPIADRYKIAMEPPDLDAAVACIRTTLDEYETRVDDFAMYRRAIAMERWTFAREVRIAFGSPRGC